MKVKLVVVKGANPTDLALRLPTIIGRSSQASLKLRTTVVSREHCEVFEKDGELFVKDLGSANGTFINGVRVEEPVKLNASDLLRVGPVTMRAEFEKPVAKITKVPTVSDGSVIDLQEKQPDGESGSLSMVNYKETPKGSFLEIEDGEVDAAPEQPAKDPSVAKPAERAKAASVKKVVKKSKPAAPARPVKAAKPVSKGAATKESVKRVPEKSKEAEEAAEVLGGIDDEVEADDSALNDFFDNLG